MSSSRRMLGIAGVLIAALACLSAVVFLSTSLGDAFAEDPAEQASVEAARAFWSLASGVGLFVFLLISSFLAGYTFAHARSISILTMLLNSVCVLILLSIFLWP